MKMCGKCGIRHDRNEMKAFSIRDNWRVYVCKECMKFFDSWSKEAWICGGGVEDVEYWIERKLTPIESKVIQILIVSVDQEYRDKMG